MAPPTDTKKRLALAIIDFLNTSLKDGTISNEDAESVEVATSCIADTFHVDPTDSAAMSEATGQQSLLQVYSVYEKLKGKTTTSGSASGSASAAGSSSTSSQTPNTPSAPNPEAEKLKGEGNKAMQSKDYAKAIDLYTKALALVPLNPIYLSNRAAAYSATSKHTEAAEDAEKAVAADPKYTKAWSRLGLAKFALGDPKASMEAYKKGIDAEGNGGSDAMKRGYETAKKRVAEQEGDGAAEQAEEEAEVGARGFGGSGAGAGAGGMPDLSSLAGMFGGAGRGGGGGGMPDLGSLMSNPMFANMAQQVMSNPGMMEGLMNNPALRGMADRMGSGGGGMPDLGAMMQDPSIAEMARNLMGGGAGGAPGAGRGRGAGAGEQ